MNTATAAKILNLTLPCSEQELKSQYRKLALKYHPDKNNNSTEFINRFQDLNEANDFVWTNKLFKYSKQQKTEPKTRKPPTVSSSSSSSSSSLLQLMNEFLQHISHSNGSTQSHENLAQMYMILKTYKNQYESHIVCIGWELIETLYKETLASVEIIVLNPTIEDLLLANVFKLNLGNDVFYVPLWHYELSFEGRHPNAKTVIVHCRWRLHQETTHKQPYDIQTITIDNHNNIVCEFTIPIEYSKHVGNADLPFDFPFSLLPHSHQFSWSIPLHKLKFTDSPHIIYCIANCGIPKIKPKNLFDASEKAHVYVHIHFV